MAGKELYIERILDQSLSGIPQMVAEMQQSTRILSNILANTGLTQSQKSFSGSDLIANSIVSSNNTPIISVGGSTQTYTNDGTFLGAKWSSGYGANALVCKLRLDLTNKNRLKGKFKGNYVSAQGATQTYVRVDGVTKATITSNQELVFDIDLSEYEGEKDIEFYTFYSYSSTTITISEAYIDDDPLFTANKILAYDNQNQIALASNVNYNTILPAEGRIDFTSNITGAAMWSSLIINGDLTGVQMSIVNNLTGEKIMDLPASANDISTLTMLTGFSVNFKFGEGSENSYISAIIFRYY